MPRVCWEEQLCVSCEFVTINSRCTDFLRSTRLVFCKPDGSQLMQRDILKHSLHPILKKSGLEQGGLNIFRRFRITKLETAEVPAALQHTWSGHAKSHVSEVYKKLLKQREWRLRWAEKTGTGFTLPGHQQAAARLASSSRASAPYTR